ncbi:sulfur carrier protein adenylyltransferase ThiF [Aquipluma nitroreducens]|uniref:Sulfur carrier protein adenylyltransferase ThiF n=1 Tax=Aquipluma nitroreducens TaxID=2010828 RepID=A0A5K7S8F8_9BACT|nr:ThiF family adenylyltransferase [Aquipluma nitroreducens]BBE17816.1 sulfur carrier protein adenylyltransferase ThiF [Aquipluma nitroreducens]
MYNRNYLYINGENQKRIKNLHILVGGCGLGSVIAECALRLGFENICIIDGDKVELSNLNRQNYIRTDIGKFKVESLKERLLQINQDARIEAITEFLTKENITGYLDKGFDVAINTIDFTSDIPFLFDEICCGANIPVLHPLNLGWGGGVIVIDQHSRKLTELQTDYRGFELCMAQHILKELMQIESVPDYLPSIIEEYTRIKKPGVSPPQLSVGSFLIASICTTLMYDLCLKKNVKTFPEIYFETV